MIHSFSAAPSPGLAQHAQVRALLGRPDLAIGRTYYVEFLTEPDLASLQRIAAALVSDLDSPYAVDAPMAAGALGIAFKLGVVDNESSSIVDFIAAQGWEATAAKVVDVYADPDPAALREAVLAKLFNASNQQLLEGEPAWVHLRPDGHGGSPERWDLAALNDEELAELGTAGGRGLSPEQMQVIRDIQTTIGAADTSDALIEALDARWSDHCAHTTWKMYGNLLKRLKAASAQTGNPNIVSMFDDNAGVWDFYGGQAITIKAETHNGPTAIAPYFGQLTKVGGVLRDILGTGLGSDPIGSFEYTATGALSDPSPIPGRPAAPQIALETIRAIREYGNTFGVPMMASRMSFHPAYRAKPFALGGSIGIIPTDQAGRQTPDVGDVVVLIGGLTGDEGMHGASASSAGAEMIESAVQIGTPLEEVKFRSAILDLRDAGCLSAITDLGAAGLNSAVGEMGEATGVWMNTALVPLKTSALPPWKILLSESQERMLLAVPQDAMDAAREICARHEVTMTALGRFVDTQRYAVIHDPGMVEQAVVDGTADEMTWQPETVLFDVPYELIDPPVEQVEVGAPPAAGPALTWPEDVDLAQSLAAVMGHPEVSSQEWANSQYDTTVRGMTAHGPQYGGRVSGTQRVNGYYWAGMVVDGQRAAAVFTTAFDPMLYAVHPVRATRQSWVRLLLAQTLAGVELGDVCLTDNFYTPHTTPQAAPWLVAMVDEVAELVTRFGTPVISGKDSSAGSVDTPEGTVHVPPGVYLSALGKVPDVDSLLPEAWQEPGNVLVRVGLPTPAYEGTVLRDVRGEAAADDAETPGALDDVDLEQAAVALEALAGAREHLVSGTMLGAGGLLSTLARCSLASGLGVDVADDVASVADTFAEHRVCALVELPEAAVPALPESLHPLVVGRLSASPGVRVAGTELLTEQVIESWSTSFERSIHEAGR